MSSFKINLLNHQKDAINKFKASKKGILIYHSLGSGKTFTGIACASQLRDAHIIFITPSSVLKQFKESIGIFKLKNTYDVYTYEGFSDLLENSRYKRKAVVVIDEAHRLRNTTGKMSSLISKYISKYAIKTILMTATPFVNHPWDISTLLNLVNEDKIPMGSKRFKLMFFSSNSNKPYNFALKNEDYFKELTLPYISLHKTILLEPNVAYVNKKIEMDDEQARLHKAVEKRVLKNSNMKFLLLEDDNSEKNKKKLKRLNAFLSQTRQLSNIIKGKLHHVSPKFKEMTKLILQNNTYPIIVYSNFIDAGIRPFIEYFKSKYPKVSIEKFTGKLLPAAKDNLVKKYNKGMIKVLCISASGSEGLDFKNTRQVHIMEPYWNGTRISQIIGRAIRYKSHIELSSKNRNVTVYKWYSLYPKEKMYKGYSADEILLQLTKKKGYINNKFDEILKS